MEKHVENLVKRADVAKTPLDALQLSQAASNCASALLALQNYLYNKR